MLCATFWSTGGRWYAVHGQLQCTVPDNAELLQTSPLCCVGECAQSSTSKPVQTLLFRWKLISAPFFSYCPRAFGHKRTFSFFDVRIFWSVHLRTRERKGGGREKEREGETYTTKQQRWHERGGGSWHTLIIKTQIPWDVLKKCRHVAESIFLSLPISLFVSQNVYF